ncbi:MAG: oxidoreductase [Paenibacillus sp.]|nr:oxidoreductase [Paenibacillus sp.]
MKAKHQIGVGILGMGSRGTNLGRNFFSKHPDVAIVGICDLSESRLEMARETFGNVPASTSIDRFLQFPDLDAVIICSNDAAHAANALAALAAGKHVYLEKPMAQTAADCDAIIEAAVRSERVLMVGLELRFCSLFEDMKRIISSGEIGDIKIGTVTDNVAVGGQYYYHNARRRKAYVRSLIMEKGVHSLDITNWLLEASPVKVYSSGGLDVFGGDAPNDKRCRTCDDTAACDYYLDVSNKKHQFKDDLCVYAEEVDVEDNSMVLIDYDNGAKISYMECHFTPDYSREFTFIGTKGKIYGFFNNEQQFKIVVTKRGQKGEQVVYPEQRPGSHGGADTGIINRFIERVKEGGSSVTGIWGARDSVAIAEAAMESSETGQPVALAVNATLSLLKAAK